MKSVSIQALANGENRHVLAVQEAGRLLHDLCMRVKYLRDLPYSTRFMRQAQIIHQSGLGNAVHGVPSCTLFAPHCTRRQLTYVNDYTTMEAIEVALSYTYSISRAGE